MSKSADAFRTISEVAEWLDTPAHVLRFWESKFTQVKPVKRAGGRRYYRPADMRLLGGIKKLLHEDGMTIKGVQKVLREQGIKHVSSLCALSLGDDEDFDDILLDEVPASEPLDTVVPFAKPAEPAPVPEKDLVETVVEAAPERAPVPAEPTVADTAPEERERSEPTPAEPEPIETEQVAEAPVAETEPAEPAAESEPSAEREPQSGVIEAERVEVTSEPEAETETATLPAFLQRSMTDRIEEDAQEDTSEPDVSESESDVATEPAAEGPVTEPAEPEPGALTHLSRIHRLSSESARQIAPLVAQLRSRVG